MKFLNQQDLSFEGKYVYHHRRIQNSSTILGGVLCENSERLLAFNYFRKKTPSEMFDRVLSMPLTIICMKSELL